MTAAETAAALREALLRAGFTYDGVVTALGAPAHAALARDETTPGLRATAGGSPVETLVRLFLLQTPVPSAQADDGWCQVLANWVIDADRPWDERLAPWLPDDCDALVVQREVLDPAAYVELWLKDEGRHGAPYYAERYDTWLSWFDEQRIEAVGFGWINLHRTDVVAQAPVHRLLEWPYDVEQPIAPAIADWGRAVHVGVDLGARLVARADLVQESTGPVGAEDPSTIVLRQQRGLRRATRVDTVLAALVGACDGDLTVGQILDAVAQLLDLDPAATRAEQLPRVRELVADGFLLAD